MTDEVSFWVASVETRHTNSVAYGATPEQALTAFIELWIGKHCPASDAEVDYPWELKEDITIGKAVMGQAYMLSNNDKLWYRESMTGADPRLAATWDALAERHCVFGADLEEAAARLTKAFGALSEAVRADKVDFGKNQGIVDRAMNEMAALVAEGPGNVDDGELVQAAHLLRDVFDPLRSAALMEPDPDLREARRESLGRYHEMSFDVRRFSTAIAMAGPKP